MNNQLIKSKIDHVLLQPNAMEVAKLEVFNAVNASIAKCYVDLNFKIPDNTEYLVNEVTDVIVEKFPSMRTAEIATALAKGIRGEYGEYFGLCVVSFEQFIAGYLTSPERKQLVDEKIKLIDQKRPEPTPDEKFNTAKNICLEAYEQVKAGKPIGLTAVTVYTFIKSLGLLEGYKGDLKEAMNALVAEKTKEIAFCMDVMKRRQLNLELERLNESIEKDALTPDQWDEVKRMGKRMVIANTCRM